MADRRLVVLGVVFIGCVLAGSTSSAQGTSPDPSATCPVTVYFGNGIDTQEEIAYTIATHVLARAVNERLILHGRDPLPIFCFDTAYATDNGALRDVVESAGEINENNYVGLWEMLSGLAPSNSRLDNLIERHLASLSTRQYEEHQDVRNQVAEYRPRLAAPQNKAVVVAHSQGNIFANEAHRALSENLDGAGAIVPGQFEIVAVATPTSVVATGDNHITLYGDAILIVPGRLNANTDIPGTPCRLDPLFPTAIARQLPGPGGPNCHSFESSYLAGSESRPRLLDSIVSAIPSIPIYANDDTYGVLQGSMLRLLAPGVLANDSIPEGSHFVEFRQPLPHGFAGSGDGSFVLDLNTNPTFIGTLTVRYVVHTPFGDSNEAAASIIVTPVGQPNRPPAASFRVIAGSQSVTSPGSLNIRASASTGEARVILEDLSSDPDGRVLARRWTTDSGCVPAEDGPCLLSEDLTTFTWGFRPGGPYIVRLSVTDDGGLSESASVTITVEPATALPMLTSLPNTGTAPEASIDPYWTLLSGPSCLGGNCTLLSAPNATNNATSKWIRPTGGTPSADPTGTYVYRLTFTLSDAEAQGAIITGRWATDDAGVDILINGASTGSRTTQTFAWAPFVVAHGFGSGTNTLDFVVENASCPGCSLNPVALRVELRGRPVSTASLPTLTGLPNTGRSSFGQADPSYVLVSGPTCPAGVCPAYQAGGNATSAFVTPTTASTHPGGQYIYQLAFMVSDTEASRARIDGQWALDDSGADILLNGMPLGVQQGPPVGVFGPFAVTAGFRPGINTLDFVVNNQDCGPTCTGNPTALRVELAGSLNESTLTAHEWFSDPSPFVYFGAPLIDDAGTLYAPRQVSTSACNFGICEIGLQKIEADGTGWLRTGLGADPFASQRLAFGPDGRVYFQAHRSTLFAFRPDGSTVPGWPVSVTDHPNPGFRAMFVDDDTGQVHLSAAGGFVSDPVVNVSLNPDGSEAWRVAAADAGGLLKGPGGDIFIVGPNLLRLDRQTGAERCRAAAQPFIGLGTPVGLFATANYNQLYRTSGDCSTSLFYTWPAASISVGAYVPGTSPTTDRLIGSANEGTIVQPGPGHLVGLDLTGALVWVQPEIQLDPIAPVRAARAGVLYVLGGDRTSGLRHTLFFVDALTGRIDGRLDVSSICTFGCNVGVGPNRRVMIADGNRIHEVR